jgi:hypothetical protein
MQNNMLTGGFDYRIIGDTRPKYPNGFNDKYSNFHSTKLEPMSPAAQENEVRTMSELVERIT